MGVRVSPLDSEWYRKRHEANQVELATLRKRTLEQEQQLSAAHKALRETTTDLENRAHANRAVLDTLKNKRKR